ncbi:MAG: hypothetical protein ACQEXE_10530 [Bacillota bacterium]
MGNFITYRLTMRLNSEKDLVSADVIKGLKSLLINFFDKIDSREDAIIFSNEHDTMVLTNTLFLLDFSNKQISDELPIYLENVFLLLEKHGISQISSAKMGISCLKTNYKEQLLSFIGIDNDFYNEISRTTEKTVNSIGLKFSLDDYEWHYEIELLPSKDSNVILTLDAFYDIDDYDSEDGDDGSIPKIYLIDLLEIIPSQKQFLLEKFVKVFIK